MFLKKIWLFYFTYERFKTFSLLDYMYIRTIVSREYIRICNINRVCAERARVHACARARPHKVTYSTCRDRCFFDAFLP
jgi:hypothetical protein